jgi:hypothetical protein
MLSEFRGISTVTQRILVGSQIGKRQGKERPSLHNLRIHHVMKRLELKYLIGGKYLGLERLGFEVETGTNASSLGCSWGKTIATVRFLFQP